MSLVEQVEAVLRQVAQEEILPRYRSVTLQRKHDGSFLTEADLASQRALQALLPALVDCPVLGEEMARAEQEALWAQSPDLIWVVDPVDGTTNFAHGLPTFSISAALMRQGRPVLGVTYLPVLDECFSAVAGEGAWLNRQQLKVKLQASSLSAALAAIDTKRLPAALARPVALAPPFHSQRNFGAGTIDWCWLAAGRFDLLLHGGQKLWDYAAGVLIAREAGCVLTGIDGDFDDQAVWQRSVLAARTPALLVDWRTWVDRQRA